ncbi:hypothetical protein C2845_PM17G09560 [Panicum miliaceum]|uniref:Uncharacterized protein n=1 Tax=Panicum miliaceum TaxID=4540 RepID=A0A3L6Q222_PANMI|nr:hypothetical protein C2845_PM17G09560 [Panicum miliaceum]
MSVSQKFARHCDILHEFTQATGGMSPRVHLLRDMASIHGSINQLASVEKKYGGMAPKNPLISKDHERSYFDSADWVLGKQAANSTGPRAAIESLKPKLKQANATAGSAQEVKDALKNVFPSEKEDD